MPGGGGMSALGIDGAINQTAIRSTRKRHKYKQDKVGFGLISIWSESGATRSTFEFDP